MQSSEPGQDETQANVAFKILVAEPLAPEGLELLSGEADILQGLDQLPQAEALIVRSGTRVDEALLAGASRLKVIARAGVGVDNIDLAAATRRGIVVVNAPTATSIAAAEHTIALLLALARHIPWAHAALSQGQWERQRFVGQEIRHKTLGLVGLGRIGQQVARRAQGLEMQVLAFDPFLGPEIAARLGVEMVGLEMLLQRSDFVSLHVPLSESTRGMIGREALTAMKPGAVLINTARGALLDEEALLDALDSGRLAGAALDVFRQEPPRDSPLLGHPRVLHTPHLAGSTREAQAMVARETAEQVLAVLKGLPAPNALNLPRIRPDQSALAPYLELARALGRLVGQVAEGPWQSLRVVYAGELAGAEMEGLDAAALEGLLLGVTDVPVNLVNARYLARERGLEVVEERRERSERFPSLLGLELTTPAGPSEVAGTVLRGEPSVVRLAGYWVDFPPRGHLLLSDHHDRPGVIGRVGTLLGQADVNISFMQVGRREPRGRAVMVLGLDEPVPPEVLDQIRAIPHLRSVKTVTL